MALLRTSPWQARMKGVPWSGPVRGSVCLRTVGRMDDASTLRTPCLELACEPLHRPDLLLCRIVADRHRRISRCWRIAEFAFGKWDAISSSAAGCDPG